MRKKNQNLFARFESQTVQHNEKEKAKPFLTSNFKLQSSVNGFFQSIHRSEEHTSELQSPC